MRVTHTAAAIALVLALAVSVTTCRLDKLINPATADRIIVNPDSVRASAHVGSLSPVDTTLHVTSADGVVLTWTATKTAAWVTLSSSADSLVVTLHPDTLSQTLHRDTVVFTSLQSRDMVRVPVVFDMLAAAPDLSMSDTARAATAFVASVLPDTFRVRIKNPGGLPLDWAATLDTSWVTLSDSGGTVPPQDTTSTSVLVTLRPQGLGTGTHRSAIAFAATGAAIGSPDTLRITYTIAPCVETGITLDTVKNSSIALSDCGAPQRPGRQGKLYAVQAALGDTLSFRLTTAAFNPWLILTNSSGTLVDSADVCGAVDIACVNYVVTAPGRYVLEATTRDSGETGAFTLLGVKERTPSPPAPGQFRANGTTAITVGAITPESTVVFKATLNDVNPFDSVQLELEVESVASGPVTYLGAFVPPGTAVAVSVTGLHDNETYHWRARTCDNSGRCSTWFNFGGNVDPAADFIVNSLPQNPAIGTLTQVGPNGPMPIGGGTTGTYPNSVTVTFGAGVTDLDPGDLISIEAEYKRTGTAFDSTTTRGGGVSTGMTATVSVSIAVQLLNLQADYHWRARVCDQTNRCSAWVSFGGNAESAIDFHVP